MMATAPPLSSCATSRTSMRYASAPPLLSTPPHSPSVAASSPIIASAPPLSPSPSESQAIPKQKSNVSFKDPIEDTENVIRHEDSSGSLHSGVVSEITCVEGVQQPSEGSAEGRGSSQPATAAKTSPVFTQTGNIGHI